jgi:putative membrane protein
MSRLLLKWLLNAIALLVTAHFVVGFHISSWISALIAVIVIGLLNATLGLFLKIITFPFSVLTLGLFLLVINAVILRLSSYFVPGFEVRTFAAAFWGAVVMAILQMIFGGIERSVSNDRQY